MSRYAHDFYAWTQEQATLLREKRFAEVDLDNLIEEVEALGRSEWKEVRSRLIVLVIHLLKWHYQPRLEAKSWRNTIRTQREEIADLLAKNPSLRKEIPAMLDNAYQRARRRAADETDLDQATFLGQCPWTVDEVLQDADPC
jgi:hypothetical protein